MPLIGGGNMRIIIITIFAIALLSCKSNKHIKSFSNTEDGFVLTEEESELYSRADRLHRELLDKGLLYKGREANRLINQLGHSLLSKEDEKHVDYRFHILRYPEANAFAVANGNIYLNAGLITETSSAEELLYVLAHEIEHVENRHSIKTYRKVTGSVMGTNIASIFLTNLIYIPMLQSIAKHSREFEQEADIKGIDRLIEHNVPLNQLPDMFRKLNQKKILSGDEYSSYSSHPEHSERRDYTLEYIESKTEADAAKVILDESISQRFLKVKSSLMGMGIDLKIKRHTYEMATDMALKAVEEYPENSDFLVKVADGYRLRAEKPKETVREYMWLYSKEPKEKESVEKEIAEKKSEFMASAKEYYYKAIEKGNNSLAYRGLGLLAYLENDLDNAIKKLEFYLDSEGFKKDRYFIENLINKMRN